MTACEFDAQFGSAIRNGLSIRAFSLELGDKVSDLPTGKTVQVKFL
jgi:hypothetical protein